MIFFVGHIVQLWVHEDSRHQPFLHLQVPTDLVLPETTTTQHNHLLLIEKNAGDVSRAFLRSSEILNFEQSKKRGELGKKTPGSALFRQAAACCCRHSPY